MIKGCIGKMDWENFNKTLMGGIVYPFKIKKEDWSRSNWPPKKVFIVEADQWDRLKEIIKSVDGLEGVAWKREAMKILEGE